MRNGKLKGSTVTVSGRWYSGDWYWDFIRQYPFYGYEYGKDVGVSYSGVQECICHVDPILMDEIYVKADCREDVWFFNNYIFDDTYMGRWIMYSELNNEKYYG
tara:strand:- start:171 stop:479 length:309 start_codon:yes stop_codon:yes gene_type:complete